MTKCTACDRFLPEYSIEWRDLPDDKKCKCKFPGVPEPPIITLLREFFKVKL